MFWSADDFLLCRFLSQGPVAKELSLYDACLGQGPVAKEPSLYATVTVYLHVSLFLLLKPMASQLHLRPTWSNTHLH